MENIKSDILFMEINGVLVVGEITRREKNYIEVSIVKPYCNWQRFYARSGMAKMSPNHYLTDYGDAAARSLLSDIYNKISMLDADFPRLAIIYQNLQNDFKVLDDFIPQGIYKRNAEAIKSKLNDWFYDFMVFSSSVTGIRATYDERKIIESIFQNYIVLNKKIYLQRLEN